MTPLTRLQDTLARLVAIPIAASVASHAVFYRRFPFQPDYHFPWPYFLTVATVMFSCWEVNLAVFRWLDHQLPFHHNPARRIIRQLLVGGGLTLLTFSIVFPVSIRLYSGQWPTANLITTGIIVCTTIATIFNGSYIGLYLLQTIRTEKSLASQLKQPALPPLPPSTSVVPTMILVDASNRQLQLWPSDIAYFYSSNGVVLLIKPDGQQLVTNYNAFTQIMSQLAPAVFFQLNRQFIVHRSAVRHVQDDVNRKLLVDLSPALHKQQAIETVTISRYRSVEFKKWLQTPVTC